MHGASESAQSHGTSASGINAWQIQCASTTVERVRSSCIKIYCIQSHIETRRYSLPSSTPDDDNTPSTTNHCHSGSITRPTVSPTHVSKRS